MRVSNNIVGLKNGMIQIIDDLGTVKVGSNHARFVRIKCECGTEKTIRYSNFQYNTRSCGCMKHEVMWHRQFRDDDGIIYDEAKELKKINEEKIKKALEIESILNEIRYLENQIFNHNTSETEALKLRTEQKSKQEYLFIKTKP